MQYSHHDVVLLNSDTEVTRNWLSKIQNCAYSKPAVATVTPLSNNATLASVPVFLAENTIPPGLSVEEYADIVEKCSMNLFPDIPTAHGFCMYIKREAIDDLGLFDEETFGKGYGEENHIDVYKLDIDIYYVITHIFIIKEPNLSLKKRPI